MDTKKRQSLTRRLLSLLLAFAVGVTFVPLLGGAAYAEDAGSDVSAGDQIIIDETNGMISDEELANMEKQIEESLVLEDEEADADAEDKATEVPYNTVAKDASTDGSDGSEDGIPAEGNLISFGVQSSSGEGGKLSAKTISNTYIPGFIYCSGTITQSGNIVTVNCKILDSYKDKFAFYGLYVDSDGYSGVELKSRGQRFTGNQVSTTFDMSQLNSTGYHTIFLNVVTLKQVSYYNTAGNKVTVSANQLIDQFGRGYLSSNNITARPTYAGTKTVYSTYLNIYPYNIYGANEAGPLYMEFSSDGGKNWGNRYKLKDVNQIKLKQDQGSMVGGLRANTNYQTRLRYGIYVTYNAEVGGDGKSYLFLGPAFNSGAIKTGQSSKPKIKSVTCKAVKVKYHKVRWPGYWNVVGGVAFWHNAYTERYYTYKVKVTIKLKKKPGTAGIWVSCSNALGEKFLNGNKKKYTTTFTPMINYSSKRPKGHVKVKVSVRSGQSSSYGGYSPYYTSKKKKLK